MRTIKILAIAILACGIATSHKSAADSHSVGHIKHLDFERSLQHDNLQNRFEITQAMSNRCFTQYFWCYLPGYAPINAPCWCATPNGPIPGIVR